MVQDVRHLFVVEIRLQIAMVLVPVVHHIHRLSIKEGNVEDHVKSLSVNKIKSLQCRVFANIAQMDLESHLIGDHVKRYQTAS